MFRPLAVCKTIKMPGQPASVARETAERFWRSRDVKFVEESEHLIIGKRGSIVANWTSYDQAQVLVTLTLLFDEPEAISARMEVNTIGQCMTDWTKAYFYLEMRTFANKMTGSDPLDKEWRYFKKERDKSAVLWSVSAMLLGNRMPRKDRYFFLSVDDLVGSNL
jgi:hypothetical protein